jgi:hypothetical protein
LLERRKARRYSADWLIKIAGAGKEGSDFQEVGVLKNLSSNGAFVILPKAPPQNANLEILIKLPASSGIYLKYSADVVRIESMPPKIGVAIRYNKRRPMIITDPVGNNE